MATTITNTRKTLMLLLTMALLLPPSILGARTGPSSPHHSQGHKRSPPASPRPPPPPPPTAPAADVGLVRATCNSTAYYDLCMSTLGADPSSATADLRGLSTIAVSAAAVNASGGAATAVALAAGGTNTTTTVDGTVQALLRTCATKYDEARDALSAARDSIAQENYDYAAVHVSAAAEYPQVCRVLFQRQRPGEYPPELAAREETLRRLCTVALDIITLLSNNTN